MAFHRIKKYSRQIVSQDCILSCHPNHIEEIPVFKRAQISGLSLRNQKTRSSGERSSWLEKDLDLSGMLVCWHLWNSRAVPFSPTKKKTESQRRTVTKSSERACQSSLTLRGQALYTAMEKYLLFLMPREMRKRRVVDRLDLRFTTRRERVSFSALYVNTALGLYQYSFKETFAPDTLLENKEGSQNSALVDLLPPFSTFSPDRVSLPSMPPLVKQNCRQAKFSQFVQSTQNCSQNNTRKEDRSSRIKVGFVQTLKRPLLRTRRKKHLSLHCPSVLNSPDIQDIAQSGLMTLEGCLTLEFF